MKKLILLNFVCICFVGQAQILNPSFESVTNNKPDNYNLTSDGYGTYFLKDTAVPYTGAKAAYIKGFTGGSYTIQGGIFGIFPISGKPLAMTGWYKCNIVAGDSIVFNPYVYASGLTSASTFAYAYTTTTTAVYKQFTANFNYTSFPSATVGTIYTGIYMSGQDVDGIGLTIPKSGTWAIIDDLALVYTPTITTAIQSNVKNLEVDEVYPQPAHDLVNIVYNINQNVISDLAIYDITGKFVKTVISQTTQTPGRYKAEVNCIDLEPGIYFAKLTAGRDVKVSKIIKQ